MEAIVDSPYVQYSVENRDFLAKIEEMWHLLKQRVYQLFGQVSHGFQHCIVHKVNSTIASIRWYPLWWVCSEQYTYQTCLSAYPIWLHDYTRSYLCYGLFGFQYSLHE